MKTKTLLLTTMFIMTIIFGCISIAGAEEERDISLIMAPPMPVYVAAPIHVYVIAPLQEVCIAVDDDDDGVCNSFDRCPDEGGLVGRDGCPLHDGARDEGDDDVLAGDDDEGFVEVDVAPDEAREPPALETPGEFHVIDAVLPRPAAEDASGYGASGYGIGTLNLGFENPADGGCSLAGSSSNSSLISILALAFSLIPLSIRRKLR